MTGIPDDFDETRRKKISEQTIRPPKEKHSEINDFMKTIEGAGEIKNLKEMGIDINTKMTRFQAKQVSNPSLELGKNKFV